jgi:hypothetical protein
MHEPLTHSKTFGKIFARELGCGPVSVGAVTPSGFGCEGRCFTALFFGHSSRTGCAADLPATPAQFGHDTGDFGWARAVLYLWGISEHFDLVVGELVKVWFGVAALTFRGHTLSVLHECVSGSSCKKFKVAHYRYPRWCSQPHRN